MDKPGTLGWGGNSGFHAINLAAQFGVTDIALTGFDMRTDRGTHWHGNHPRGLNNPTAKNAERWRKAIDAMAPDLAVLGIRVVNCSEISALTAYSKIGFEAWLGPQ